MYYRTVVFQRSTLQYDGLHDRPLKHYFGPKDIKVALTQMKSVNYLITKLQYIKNHTSY